MANNTSNGGGASSYYYSNYPSQTAAADDEQDKMIMTIVLPVFVVGILLLKLLCFCIEKDREEEEQEDAGGGNGAGQQRSREAAGSWADDEVAVEVAPAWAAEPPLVCTYRNADGWGDDTSCGVCLAELADGDVLRVLPACVHYFHADCIGEWLRAHATCPLCRAPLVAAAAAA